MKSLLRYGITPYTNYINMCAPPHNPLRTHTRTTPMDIQADLPLRLVPLDKMSLRLHRTRNNHPETGAPRLNLPTSILTVSVLLIACYLQMLWSLISRPFLLDLRNLSDAQIMSLTQSIKEQEAFQRVCSLLSSPCCSISYNPTILIHVISCV